MPKASHGVETNSNADAEHFGGGHLKGSLVSAHIDWVRDHRDRHEVVEFFESIPLSMRNVLVASWYRFEDLIAVDRVIVDQFGDGELRFLQELGAYSAQRNLAGVNQPFQQTGIHELFRGSALLHSQFQDFGSTRYLELASSQGQIVQTGYPSYSPLYCASAAGFYQECIKLHGGMDIAVWESRCRCWGDGTCTFELSWT